MATRRPIKPISSSYDGTSGAATAEISGFREMETTDVLPIENIPNLSPSKITQDANNRFTSDTEKATWNAKQSNIGFTPENAANKAADFTVVNNNLFPTVQAAKTNDDAARDAAITTIRGGVASDGDTLAKLRALVAGLQSIVGGTAPDGDSVVNTVTELLAIMSTFPEGVDVLNLIGSKVNSADVLNALTQTAAGKVLDARQGKILSDSIAAKSDINATANAQTGTAYTVVAGDNGKIITMNNAAANTVTIPASLGAGFNCLIVQIGAGQTTLVASGTTLNSADGLKIAARYGGASIVAYAANVFAVSGRLTT